MLSVLLLFTIIFGQGQNDPFGPSGGGDAGAPCCCNCCCGGGGILGVILGLLLPLIMVSIFVAPMFIGMWKVLTKAGEEGWKALVPVYNLMTLAKIAGRQETDGLMCLIPFYGIYMAFLIYTDLCAKFGKEQGFAILLLLIPAIGFPILGFGSAEYSGKRRSGGKNPRREADDDDDDDRSSSRSKWSKRD